MSSVRVWVSAFRLRTLPLSLSCIFTGSAFIPFRPQVGWIMLLVIVTTIFLQILSNLANDYGDFQNGADTEDRVGPKRTVQSGAISPHSMKKAMTLFAGLSFISGCGILLWLGYKLDWIYSLIFLAIGIFSIWAAIRYTSGNNPYGYRGLGDVYVFLFFGLVGVLATDFIHQLKVDLKMLFPAFAMGLIATAVLNLNNMRDIQTDRTTGKITIPVRLGLKRAKVYHLCLIVFAWLWIIATLIELTSHWSNWLVLIMLPIHVLHTIRVFNIQRCEQLDPELKKIALSAFFIALIFLISPL